MVSFPVVENLSVYDFTVTKNWKGVAAGQTVSILFNTTWGDNYLPGSHFLKDRACENQTTGF